MKLVIYFLLLMIALVTTARAQWTQTDGPPGATIRALAHDGHAAVAVLWPDRLYRHDGSRWRALGTLEAFWLGALGETLVAHTPSGLTRSTDHGSSWSLTTGDASMTPVGIDGSRLYLADRDGLYRSDDAGESWSALNDTLSRVETIAASGDLVVAGRTDIAAAFISNDGGTTWRSSSAGLPEQAFIRLLHVASDTILASLATVGARRPAGIFRSIDGGMSWQRLIEGLESATEDGPWVQEIYREAGSFAVASTEGTFRLRDTAWVRSSIAPVMQVVQAGDEEMARVEAGGVSMSTDDGREWIPMNDGLREQIVHALQRSGGRLVAASPLGVFTTDDRGSTWTQRSYVETAELVSDGSALLARGFHTMHMGLARSTDDGTTWQTSGSEIGAANRDYRTIASAPGVLYAGLYGMTGSAGRWTAGGVHRSTDGGATWAPVNAGLPMQDSIAVPVNVLVAGGSTVLASTHAGFYRSTDRGASWSEVVTDSIDLRMAFKALHHDGVFYIGVGHRITHSTDNGATWEIAPGGSELGDLVYSMAAVGDDVVAVLGTERRTSSLVRFDGARWVRVGPDLPDGLVIRSIESIGETIFLGTEYASVWRGTLGVAAAPLDPVLSNATLRIVPQPVTGDAALELQLVEAAVVDVEIVDALGTVVWRSARTRMTAGPQRIALETDGLARGAYLWRAHVGAGTHSGRLFKMR